MRARRVECSRRCGSVGGFTALNRRRSAHRAARSRHRHNQERRRCGRGLVSPRCTQAPARRRPYAYRVNMMVVIGRESRSE